MIDALPFPNVRSDNPEGQISDLINYLIQFKETLEFALMNISAENLSPELINQLNELGANIEQSKTERENELAQVSHGNSLTIFDVVNSDAFKLAVKNGVSNITFNINFDTGHLEYDMSNEEG